MINKTKKILETKNFAILKGGVCLSDTYINSKEKLEWKCSNTNHPTWFSSYSNILSNGRWCPVCAIERRSEKRKNNNGLEEAQQYALEKGGICLSTEYVGVFEKLEWKCANESHPSWLSSFANIVNGKRWCPVCGRASSIENRKNKHGLREAQQYALQKGGVCLSTEYISARDKLEWTCANEDHPSWFSTYDTVINRKTWCVNCVNDKNFEKWRTEGLKNANEYARTRGGICLSTEFFKGREKLEWKCSNENHPSWFGSYHSVTSKQSWCSQCIVSISEFKVNNILNYLLDTNFLKNRALHWNINPKTNRNLELDGYCDNLKIAFEFQGSHHYELAFNNEEEELEYIKYKDQLKKQNCANNNITLIIINDIKTKKFETFYKEILRGIETTGIKINEDRKNNILKLKELYNLNPINDKHNIYLEKAQEYAKFRGGKCLSLNYINSPDKMEWKCSNPTHPSWFALYYSVVGNKSWCHKCYRERRTKNSKKTL